MKFFLVKPEVAGCMGSETVGNRQVRPPQIERLVYEFEDWLGDDVVSTVGIWVGTKKLTEALRAINATGFDCRPLEVIKSKEFRQWNPRGLSLPKFVWLDITGRPGLDDFGRSPEHHHRVIVSERALEVMKSLALNHAQIEPCEFDSTPSSELNQHLS